VNSNNKIEHESGMYHVTGEAVYIDDIPTDSRQLHGHVVYSPHAHAQIKSCDLKEAKKLPGVYKVISHEDILGVNNMGPVFEDEPILAENEVIFIGQAIFLIAAENESIAREAEKLIKIEYEVLEPILTLEDAMKNNSLLHPERIISLGDSKKGLKDAEYTLKGSIKTGAQEHWYLETQVCLCEPGEGHEIIAYSSTQHPSETQALIAKALNIPKNEVEVQVRRMGGAFGGKETQANHTAIWAALLTQVTRRPVKIRLFRDDDQKITGKRHPYLIHYNAGFDRNGVIQALEIELNADAGSSTDLSMAVLERAMMHADNAYYIPNIHISGRAWKTNLPSNTAFRGFGGPQGMVGIETIIDRIARMLKKDPAEIRFKNFYGTDDRNLTPYHQEFENNHLPNIYGQLMKSSDYRKRREAVNQFNLENEFFKKGIALTPVKFGISFTTSFLNQAGALVNIYLDGTALVNHGGTEMGQGLHTKIKQIAALELGITLDKVKVNATNTSKVPNTSATAASAGTDLNGMAVIASINKLKKRIGRLVAEEFNKKETGNLTKLENLVFENDYIYDKQQTGRKIPFTEALNIAYLQRISLSATGFYRTPKIHFDREKGKGHPYYYYAMGDGSY